MLSAVVSPVNSSVVVTPALELPGCPPQIKCAPAPDEAPPPSNSVLAVAILGPVAQLDPS